VSYGNRGSDRCGGRARGRGVGPREGWLPWLAWVGCSTHVGFGRLGEARGGGAVEDRLDALGVAPCRGQAGRVHLEQIGARRQEATFAARALDDGDLVAGRARGAGSFTVGGVDIAGGGHRCFERRTCDEQQRRIVIEALATALGHAAHGISEGSERLAADLEAQHVFDDLGARHVRGQIARHAARHQALDLTHPQAPRGFNPRGLGARRGHPRELAHRTGVQPSIALRPRQLGQLLERLRRAQLVLGGAVTVPQMPVCIFGKSPIPQVPVHVFP